MFDIGFTELMVIGIVALIVVGPKDLPQMFRTLGRFTARARALGREFTSAMNAAADESGMRDAANELKGVASPRSYGVNKLKEAADAFDNWDPTKPAKTEGGDAETEEAAAKPVMSEERKADMEKIRAATEKAGRAKLEREAQAKAADTAPAKESTAKAKPKAKSAAKPAAPASGGKKPAAKASPKPKSAPKKAAKPAESSDKAETE